jgi:hypothetical protein
MAARCVPPYGSIHHQHVEHDHRRQAQDHRPDAERPKNVPGAETLLFREWIVLTVHDAPAFCVVVMGDCDTRQTLKSRSQYRSHLTTCATVDLPRWARKRIPSASGQHAEGQNRRKADQHGPQTERRHQKNIFRPLGPVENRMPAILNGLSGHCFPQFFV